MISQSPNFPSTHIFAIAGENVVINQLNTTVRHGRCFVDLNKTFIHSHVAV